MANKISHTVEKASVGGYCTSGNPGDFVQITDDEKVSISGPGGQIFGSLRTKAIGIDDWWGIETRYDKIADVPFTGAITAGQFVKIGAVTLGVQSFSAWVEGTDPESQKFGICWKGGTSGGTILY